MLVIVGGRVVSAGSVLVILDESVETDLSADLGSKLAALTLHEGMELDEVRLN